jgi:membrane associated rhomboid family serine protease
MRQPPPLKTFPKFPVTSGTIALALIITLIYWSGKVDITPLTETIDIRRGQLWRLLTSTLPHADILHLAFNLYWTWVFGTLVEESFGHWKTLVIFLLLAVVSSGAEYAILDGGIGLSGIGYGLFGLLWVLSRRSFIFKNVIDSQTIGLFVVWFFFCIILTMRGTPIANIAHGAGALTGALIGWAITAPSGRLFGSIALAALLVATLLAATLFRPWINLSPNRGYDEGKLGYDDLVAGRNADAVRWLHDATHMRPTEASFWFNLGLAQDRLNDHAAALAAFKRAHDLDPTDADYKAAAEDSQ